MTVAPNLASSMDLSSALPDVSGVEPGTLLLLVGVLITLAAARILFGLLRLVGVLFKAIVQLFRAFGFMVVALGLILGWGYHHLPAAGTDSGTDTTVVAPAPIAADPTLGRLATPHK
jgi:hypothetical protein